MAREKMMYRAVFNTAFIRSNILMLNRDEIDILWDAKDLFPKDFRAELLFSDMDTAASTVPVDLTCFEEEGLPIEAFAKVQEMFSSVDWLAPKNDAALNAFHQIVASDNVQVKLETGSQQSVEASNLPNALTLCMNQGKESTASLENKPKSTSYMAMEKPSSPDAGAQKIDGQTFGPRSDVETQKLLPPLPPKSPSSPTPPSPPPPIGNLNQSPFPPSMLPSSPSLKDTKDTTVEPSQLLPSTPTGPETSPLVEKRGTVIEPARSPPTGHLTESSFSPSILHPSPLKKGKTDIKVKPFQSLSSPPTGPGTPPLKDKRGTILEPSQTLAHPQHFSSSAGPSLVNDIGTRSGPPSAPHPPSTSFREDQAVRTETTSAAPTATVSASPPTPSLKDKPVTRAGPSPPPPPPPPPPPHRVREGTNERVASLVPPPPPPPARNSSSLHGDSASQISSSPPPPHPPIFSANGNVKKGVVPPPPPSLSRAANISGAPPPPPLVKGRSLSRIGSSKNQQSKKLKPLHWLKLTRAVSGSLWAETQKSGEAAKAPEIDISELESLFSASNPMSEQESTKAKSRAVVANKPDKVQLIEHRRAYNCEIMLSKVKMPLNELMDHVLALEDSAMEADQVDNLIKFCPTKEEMELLKGYKGETDKLGKCEQFFLELMKVPRTESKLRVFSFKLQFNTQVADLRKSLNIVNSAVEQTRGSAKLKKVMQTILSLGNALNKGTARGSAVGFRLDSLLKLTETRTRNNRMTLMHYLCKVLADKLPEVLDFPHDLSSLEPAAKIQLKYLAEEMQAISKGLEKVVQELSMAENDGPVSEIFRKDLKEFLCSAEGEARSLASLYSAVGKNVDALIIYFGEDPTRCPYEQVVSTLVKFVRMFNQANEENAKQIEAEKKKAEKEASNEKMKQTKSDIKLEHIPQSPVKSGK